VVLFVTLATCAGVKPVTADGTAQDAQREPKPPVLGEKAGGKRRLVVGDKAAGFGLAVVEPAKGTLGEIVWLSDFVGPQAKHPKHLLLLNFFAVWCAACLEELPVLEALYREHGEAGLQVLSINVRGRQEQLNQAREQSAKITSTYGLTYPVLFDPYTTRTQSLYVGDPAVLPCNVLVGRDGRVVGRLQGKEARPDELGGVVRRLLGVEVQR